VLVFVFENGQARISAREGVAITPLEGDTSPALRTDDLPAIVNAIESRDPVVSLASPAQISPEIARLLNPEDLPDRKAYLFPVVVRQSVMAMLVASGVEVSAPLELLCEAGGIRLESIAAAAVPIARPGVNQVPASATSGPRSWDDLTPEDHKLHLQAQRTARVRVAEMRLSHSGELQTGTANADIYSALKPQIDKAREQFLQTFLSKSPTMVDYLHLEILRTLAHDDDRLLGHNYPGPMV